MNEMTNEQKNMLREQVHTLLDIVLDCNSFERRSRERTGTLPSLFFSYSGHVNLLRIDLHKDGWVAYGPADKVWEFRLDKPIGSSVINEVFEETSKACEDKTEIDILKRDILRQEGKLKDEKDKLAILKKTLKRKERKEKADAVDAGHNED